MKKLSVVICVLILSVFLTGTAFGQMKNVNAYFMLDNNLATAGYQSLGDVKNIGGDAKIGFAMYAKKWDEATGIRIVFEWDETQVEYIKAESGLSIASSAVTLNGASITLAAEDNIISNTFPEYGFGEIISAGSYENTYQLLGGAGSKKAEGLIFYAVFKTSATFSTQVGLTIGASVDVVDAAGNTVPLGTRYFHVNTSNDPTDVKPATWKEVKEQFKDF